MQEPKIIIDNEILNLVAEIDEFNGNWQLLKTLVPEHLSSLRKTATVESIGSSTRIEGAILTDIQVETLLSQLKITSFKTRDEQEVAGYAETIDLVFEAFEDIRITENHIKQLHQLLLKHSTKDSRHRGDYKKLSNNVVAVNDQGKEIGVIFETATPFDTPREMEALVAWFNKSTDLHPLLAIAIFIVTFLAIHPFQDGNGRLSRILTTLLLLRAGYSYVTYVSMEHIIEEHKDLYYKALRRTQITLKNETQDLEPWTKFFLRILKKQKNKLTSVIDEKRYLISNLPELSIKIIELLKKHERLTISTITHITNANSNTIKLRLRELVSAGYIEQHGKARATWYTAIGNIH